MRGVLPDKVVLYTSKEDGVERKLYLWTAPLRKEQEAPWPLYGGTIHRKGIDLLLDAYVQAFRRSDDVCLVIKDMGVGSFYRGQTAEKRYRWPVGSR